MARTLLAIGLVVVVGAAVIGAVLTTQWLMQASGWNCFMREQGYAQGLGEPPEQSPYCTGNAP